MRIGSRAEAGAEKRVFQVQVKAWRDGPSDPKAEGKSQARGFRSDVAAFDRSAILAKDTLESQVIDGDRQPRTESQSVRLLKDWADSESAGPQRRGFIEWKQHEEIEAHLQGARFIHVRAQVTDELRLGAHVAEMLPTDGPRDTRDSRFRPLGLIEDSEWKRIPHQCEVVGERLTVFELSQVRKSLNAVAERFCGRDPAQQ